MEIDFTEAIATIIELSNDLAVIRCDIEDNVKDEDFSSIHDQEFIQTCMELRGDCKRLIKKLREMEG